MEILNNQKWGLAMLIQCTKKLLDELKMEPELIENSNYDPLFAWHANLIMVNRKKTVVLVNDKNRYLIVLHGLKAKDFQKLGDLILQAIQKTFEEEGINDETIEKYLNSSKDIFFTKTKDRTSVARMNRSIEDMYAYGHLINSDAIINSNWSVNASRMLMGDGKKDYFYPNEELYKNLEAFAGESDPVFSLQAAVFKVTLRLERHQVWRRLVVPLHLTFEKLHEVLQEAFAWENYHLHEFYILDGDKPIVNLVGDENEFETFGFQEKIETKFETDVKLSDYIPQYKQIKYIYDFGDHWEHILEVEDLVGDYDKNYPICIEGEGIAPPEDVGGEPGYEEYLRILTDENHSEYKKNMVNRNVWKGNNVFDIGLINRRIKRV